MGKRKYEQQTLINQLLISRNATAFEHTLLSTIDAIPVDPQRDLPTERTIPLVSYRIKEYASVSILSTCGQRLLSIVVYSSASVT